MRYLILRILSERPMHGYEIMKRLSEELGGFYRPSAGAIYPILQRLEEEGYVKGEKQERRRVYSITPSGLRFLKEKEEEIGEVLKRRNMFLKERRGLNLELRNLVSLIMTNYYDLTPEQVEKLSQILREARKRINEVIFE
ncbi:PadR family transcriptional regulator [Candidatus Bathyarchaeota archaeon]|nr:PadR family transcriptional regulator [Candidatus Bathyarchaeota archaeon]